VGSACSPAMGQTCANPCTATSLKAKFVCHVGERRTLNDSDNFDHVPKYLLKCDQGHTMEGHVVREMFAVCSAATECWECETDCGCEVSCYRCKPCGAVYCNNCSRTKLGLPRQTDGGGVHLEVMPGDIFMAGPDKFGIHHVILCRSEWQEVDPEVYACLTDLEPGTHLLACETIESTQGSVGDDTWWYPATTYFCRNPRDGSAMLLADLKNESREISQAMEPVPTKVLLHPLRGHDDEDTFNDEAFEEIIGESAQSSKKYGKFTAVRSVISGLLKDEVIHASKYQTEQEKVDLMTKIRKTWQEKPICASVAVQCWQRYLERISDSDVEAADEILKYMPHWCHKSTPSSLVKELTQHGWVMSDSFDA